MLVLRGGRGGGGEEGSGGRQRSHGGVSDNRMTTNISQVNAFIVRCLPISIRKATLSLKGASCKNWPPVLFNACSNLKGGGRKIPE